MLSQGCLRVEQVPQHRRAAKGGTEADLDLAAAGCKRGRHPAVNVGDLWHPLRVYVAMQRLQEGVQISAIPLMLRLRAVVNALSWRC